MISSAVAWQRAVILGAQGRYLAAWWWLDRIDHGQCDGGRMSLSLSTRGSHLRQVGAITQAHAWDSRALESSDDAQAVVDAHLGLAADAIADGEVVRARSHLQQAADGLVGLDDRAWRVATRVAWVRSEALLLEGRIDDAIESARHAVDLCRSHSERHRVKSEAILAAALCARGERSEASRITHRIASEAQRQGWASLSWPIALIALDTQCDAESDAKYDAEYGAEPSGAPVTDDRLRAIVAAGAHATRVIEAHLPNGGGADLAGLWRARSDVGRLRSLAGG